jgi:hypothetical protein
MNSEKRRVISLLKNHRENIRDNIVVIVCFVFRKYRVQICVQWIYIITDVSMVLLDLSTEMLE